MTQPARPCYNTGIPGGDRQPGHHIQGGLNYGYKFHHRKMHHHGSQHHRNLHGIADLPSVCQAEKVRPLSSTSSVGLRKRQLSRSPPGLERSDSAAAKGGLLQ